MAEAAGQDASSDARDQSIRDAAKWLIATSGAVVAVLAAGSQLSSLGALPPGPRLVAAAVGAVVAIGCVVLVIRSAADLLVPQGVAMAEITAAWGEGAAPAPPKGHRLTGAVTFLHDNPTYLQSFTTPALLVTTRQQQLAALPTRSAHEKHEARKTISALQSRERTVVRITESRLLEDMFRRTKSLTTKLGVAAAVGITLFAWAANPVEASGPSLVEVSLVGADLKGADLSGVDLTGADLTDADLTGADLADAVTTGVTWAGATCPDGTKSDDAGGTCRGHL